MPVPPLISCIALLDEFPWNHHIPWRDSLDSALQICDELIIVLGGRPHCSPDIPIRRHLKSLLEVNRPRLHIVDLSWPAEWSWMFIAHALNIGLLHARGDWACRLLMDELFPVEQRPALRDALRKTQRNVVSLCRSYVLGKDLLYPAVVKPFFFRRNAGWVYGRVSPDSPDALMFDNPVRLGFWGKRKFQKTHPDNYLSLFPLPPLGERNSYRSQMQESEAFILNTDVTFCSAEELLLQKYESKKGYERLPGQYRKPLDKSPEEVVAEHLAKIERFMTSENIVRYSGMPEGVVRLFRETDAQHAPILKLLSQTQVI